MRADTATSAVTEKIENFVAGFGMFAGNGGVLAGFSGGADSTALLHWLAGYCAGRGLRLAALHVNHKIRGEEAERDAEFCKAFCGARGIEFFYREADVPALAGAAGKGIEETAREARYAAFEEIASEHGLSWIATAHNADDNLETVIFNLARGTAASGLAGIPPVRGKIARPLLLCEKSELLAYCREQELLYMTDSTNADMSYTRNFIRGEIIPRLERINPAVRRNLSRMCRAVRQDDETLDALAARYKLSDGREVLAALPDPLLFRTLSSEFGDFSHGGTLEYVHLEKLSELLRSNRASFMYSLPCSVRFYCDRNVLLFGLDQRGHANPPEKFTVTLREGVNELPRGMLLIPPAGLEAAEKEKYLKPFKIIYKLFIQAEVRSDRIVGVLLAELPLGSAKIRFRGMTRSVKNLLGERKLTSVERERMVMLSDGEGPFWIPGVALRDGCGAEPGDVNTLDLFYFYI